MYRLALFMVFVIATPAAAQIAKVDFEDKSLPEPNSAYYGQDCAGGFNSRGASFNNSYTDFGGGFFVWSGFAYSNFVDVNTAGFGNQFAAYHLPTGGGDGSSLYGVAFDFDVGDARITLPSGTKPLSISITNTTYTALSMRDGDSFSKKFGGPTGNDPDFFLLNIQGRDSSNNITGIVPFYLADYRFSNNALDYIVSQWTTVDLSSLPANTTGLTFEMTSTDVGPFGMNTPSYFALDNLAVAVPEPVSLALLGFAGILAGGYSILRFRRNPLKTATSSRG